MITTSPLLATMIVSNKKGLKSIDKPAVQIAPAPDFSAKKDTFESKKSGGLGKFLSIGGSTGFAAGFTVMVKKAADTQKIFEKAYREDNAIEQSKIAINRIKALPKKLSTQMLNMAASDLNKDKTKFIETVTSSKNEAGDFMLYLASMMEENKYALGAIGAVAVGVAGLCAGAVVHKFLSKDK